MAMLNYQMVYLVMLKLVWDNRRVTGLIIFKCNHSPSFGINVPWIILLLMHDVRTNRAWTSPRSRAKGEQSGHKILWDLLFGQFMCVYSYYKIESKTNQTNKQTKMIGYSVRHCGAKAPVVFVPQSQMWSSWDLLQWGSWCCANAKVKDAAMKRRCKSWCNLTLPKFLIAQWGKWQCRITCMCAGGQGMWGGAKAHNVHRVHSQIGILLNSANFPVATGWN